MLSHSLSSLILSLYYYYNGAYHEFLLMVNNLLFSVFVFFQLALLIRRDVLKQSGSVFYMQNNAVIKLEEIAKEAIFFNMVKQYRITSRESEMLKYLLSGAEYKDISRELNISLSTIKKHINNIYKKCEVKNRIEIYNLFTKNSKNHTKVL